MSETSKHMKSEHDIDDYKPYKCKHCDYTHNHIRFLAEHVKNHNPNRSFICDICGASLKSASSLKYHKTSYHKKGMQGRDSWTLKSPIILNFFNQNFPLKTRF